MIIEVVGPRLLGPAIVLAVAIIVKGYADVGDAFSGAVIVALAVGLRYVSLGRERAERTMPILRHAPLVTAIGLLLALGVGFVGVVRGEPPFSHLPAAGEAVTKIGSLELITAVAFDAGLFLLVTGALVVLIHHLAELVEVRES